MGFCNDALEAGQKKLEAAMSPLIEQSAGIVQKMHAKGLDPRKFYDAKNDAVIDMVQLLADLVDSKNTKSNEIKKEVDKNCKEVVEYIQEVVDFAVTCYTYGLSEVLPKHMTHIDVEEILGGRPLGGDNSVFNVIRDQVFFKAIGIDADSPLGRAVSNPFGGSNLKDGVNQLLEQWGIPIRL